MVCDPGYQRSRRHNARAHRAHGAGWCHARALLSPISNRDQGHGEWVKTTKPLFPGYLICDTADPRTVQQYLLRMDDFVRVLAQDGQFVPLAKEEVQLIGGFTHRGDRVVPMSEALKDGDQVVVTAGPLLGHEGLIKSINRRKSTAYLELDLCGRRVTTRVGLAVLSAEQRAMRNLKKAIA